MFAGRVHAAAGHVRHRLAHQAGHRLGLQQERVQPPRHVRRQHARRVPQLAAEALAPREEVTSLRDTRAVRRAAAQLARPVPAQRAEAKRHRRLPGLAAEAQLALAARAAGVDTAVLGAVEAEAIPEVRLHNVSVARARRRLAAAVQHRGALRRRRGDHHAVVAADQRADHGAADALEEGVRALRLAPAVHLSNGHRRARAPGTPGPTTPRRARRASFLEAWGRGGAGGRVALT